jgi:zinc transport system ATP-binding protein
MQVDHTKNIVEIKNMSFSYGQEQVLKDINLNVHKGDYLGIIGPNGGGKTTLLKIMLRLLKPDFGTISLFGQNISNFKDWSKIGYVSQRSVSFESNFPATVFEVVSMGRYGKVGMFHSLGKEDKKIVENALSEVEMLDFKDRIIGDLSGGQKQRVFIARALASQPELIFLDEPTVGVDAKTQESFYNLLKKLNQTFGLTLVLVSHDIDVVASESTELACVNKTLIYDSNPQDFFSGEIFKKMYGQKVKYVLHDH